MLIEQRDAQYDAADAKKRKRAEALMIDARTRGREFLGSLYSAHLTYATQPIDAGDEQLLVDGAEAELAAGQALA